MMEEKNSMVFVSKQFIKTYSRWGKNGPSNNRVCLEKLTTVENAVESESEWDPGLMIWMEVFVSMLCIRSFGFFVVCRAFESNYECAHTAPIWCSIWAKQLAFQISSILCLALLYIWVIRFGFKSMRKKRPKLVTQSPMKKKQQKGNDERYAILAKKSVCTHFGCRSANMNDCYPFL